MKRLLSIIALILTLACLLVSCEGLDIESMMHGGISDQDKKNEENSPEHTHVFGEWTTVTEATCTEDGLQKRTCECGEKEDSIISKTKHEINNNMCQLCGKSTLPYIGSNGNWFFFDEMLGDHVDSGFSATVDSCKEHDFIYKSWPDKPHLMMGICSKCEDAIWIENDHEWTVREVVSPTCTAEGYTLYSCSCGFTKKEYVPVIDHIPSEKFYVKNETDICSCEWNNPWWIDCTACGTTLEEGADGARGHSYTAMEPIIPEHGSDICNFREGFRWICDNCDCPEHIRYEYSSEVRGHNFADGICVDCGAKDPDYEEPNTHVMSEDPSEFRVMNMGGTYYDAYRCVYCREWIIYQKHQE